jgi:hypothetical protein
MLLRAAGPISGMLCRTNAAHAKTAVPRRPCLLRIGEVEACRLSGGHTICPVGTHFAGMSPDVYWSAAILAD